ncbi:putative nuclear pore protein [Coniochaeta sp. 2T2.1]|nr:putative nuclear pore protein [Coniochaeta sp. 2T2.1]
MSFGTGGFGSGGFGQQNNTTQPSAFGGFGSSTTNTGSGFGAPATNTTFGATNTTGGGLFGSNTGGTSTFGGSGGGFGQTNSAFGAAKPAFGAATTTAGGGLFGSSTTATTGTTGGFGGFGQTNTASTGSGFGGGSSLFGGAKPATGGFGTTTTPATGTSLFGGGGTTTGGFGSSGTSAFGATNNPGLGAVGEPPGTAQVPFTATTEKEANNPTQSNAYQSILFQEPYKKWSAEELRLTDYNQGRRFGNATGTGAFGVSSGFGSTGFGTNTTTQPSTGFGATNTGTSLFGSSQPAATPFGQTATNTTGGFGSSGGGLFGGAKPATGGLFGSTAAQPSQTTGLFGGSGTTGFGSTANTGTGFGAAANTSTGGGLFGNTASNTAAKPAFGGFGSTGASTGGFGSTNITGGFGSNTNTASTGTGLFGGATQTQPAAGGGLFGNTQQQNTGTGFGSSGGFGQPQQNQAAGSSLFAPKPAGGLFGNTAAQPAAGASPFGTASTTTNAFGAAANNNQQQSGGLFGNKPPQTGTGLFGGPTQQPAGTGTGLFGSLGSNTQQQQPAAGGGLFGGQQQQKPSPFGSTLGQGTGGGLFGNTNNQQSGGLFGNTNQQQQQQGGSMFGGSQNNQQQQSLSTSINDISAYGSTSLFSGMGNNENQNPGPLATPLNGNKNKTKSRSILPMYKLSPANASRFVTPQKRGFGFSYSTYGTPSSVSSVSSTPGGLGQSLLMGSTNRGLAKSISTSSLRRSFNVEDSILAPGSFSASSGPRLIGGHKKLVINKDMRSDLFSSPAKNQFPDTNGARKLTKRVSFETSTNQPAFENGNNQASGTNTPDESAEARDLGYMRPSNRQTNGTNGAPVSETPEMEQVKGKELAIVHEEEPAAPAVRVNQHGDTEPGEYWMSPSKEQIMSMNRIQRQSVEKFAVGRENVGSVSFKVPVDLSNIDLDELYGNTVILEPRSATVYPIAAKKPPVGKGLNVPATISLEQSWPRARDKRTPVQDKTGSRIAKHIERLKRIENTTFEDYDADLGIWTFSVEHFTTYGLDDDDDEEEDETEAEVAQPATAVARSAPAQDTSYGDYASPDVDPDDTFEFKRSRRPVPGAFEDGTALSDDEEMGDSDNDQLQRRASPQPEMAEIREEYDAPRDDESMAEGYEEERQLVRAPSSVGGESVREQEEEGDNQLSQSVTNDPQVPAGIMRARMRAVKKATAPTKIQVAGGDDWTQILQQSVRAPRRMDRAALRALNESGAAWEVEDDGSPAPKKQKQNAADTAGFATSIDLMKSLFEQSKGPAQSVQGVARKGFVKWPYQRRDKVTQEEDELELAYRSAPRVEWGHRSTAVTTVNERDTAHITITKSVEGEELAEVPNLQLQIDQTEIKPVNGIPTVMSKGPVTIKSLAIERDNVWELASVLFDNDGEDLSKFWEKLVEPFTEQLIAQFKTTEEKAIIYLAGNQPSEACKQLLAGKNFRLATLVAAVGANDRAKKDVREQLKHWQESNALSDFSEPIRALYEILAGNTCVCDGVKGVPIENRIDSFIISDRFNLNWMQAFGLRLWHGGFKSVSQAVKSFKDDIDQDLESDPDSPLWGLLKLFASRSVDYGDYSLTWQLSRALYSNGYVSFGDKAEVKLDETTRIFAAQLIAKGEWLPSLFVLLHLSDPRAREAAIRQQLGRNAQLIDDKDKDRVLSTLTQTFHIPPAWIYEAKALHARAVLRDPAAEFAYLLLAGDYLEANRTFLKRVAPTAVVQRRYADLFQYARLLYRIRDELPDFASGAGVYLLFPAAREWDEKALPGWIDNLTQGLTTLRQNTSDESVLEVAAIADMAEDLVKMGNRVWKRGGEGKLYRMASSLPLTEDRRQKYLRDLVYEGTAMVVGGR